MFTVQSKGLRNHENVLGLSCDWSYPHTQNILMLFRLSPLIDVFQYTLTRSLSRASRSIQMSGVKQMRCFGDVFKVNLLIRQMRSF